MGQACIQPQRSTPDPRREHPVTAIIAVLAIYVAILLITWARIEVQGTGDLEEALVEAQAQPGVPVLPPKDIKAGDTGHNAHCPAAIADISLYRRSDLCQIQTRHYL